MSNKKHIKWLYEQLPELISKGIIQQDQAEKLKEHFGEAEEKPAYHIGFIVVGILGTLLISGGIILIFAYNWENLPKAWRTIFSFAPLVIAQIFYGYAYFKKRDSITWVEGASIFLMLMIAASIALVSQTYHISGTMENFLWIWLVLSIPLMYLLPASLAAIVYQIGIASWAMQRDDSDSVWYWLLLVAVVPHLVLNLRKQAEPIRQNLLGWTLVSTILFGWFGTIETSISEFSFLGTNLLFSTFYLLGEQVYHRSRRFVDIPFQVFGVTGIAVFLLFLTYQVQTSAFMPNEILYGKYLDPPAGIVNFIVLLLLMLGYGYLLLKDFMKRNIIGHFAAFIPFFMLLVILLSRSGLGGLAMLLSNLYLLAYGIAYLVNGVQARRMSWVNIGLLFILALATLRFFDTDWSFVVKGIAFILLGLGFLSANIILSRRIKSGVS